MIEVKENDLYFAKVKPEAIIPTREEGNAGFDIYACFDEEFIIINPNETKLIPTGIASTLHPSKYLQVEERGSTGSKGIKKSAGVIDSNYRGEIFIALTNCTTKQIVISKMTEEDIRSNWYYFAGNGVSISNMLVYPYDKAIAQLIVHDVPIMDIKEVTYDELTSIPSNRGDGKLGSSGK